MKRVIVPARALCAGLALSTAAFAGAALAAEPAGPSFDQVLAAPDDVQLNLDYAKARAQAGDLLEAAGALERILLVNPNQSDVRLFYAVVLYRLDDMQNASEQLSLADGKGLSPLQQSEVAKYRRLIAKRTTGSGKRKVTFGGQIEAGVGYEQDAFGALNTQFDFLGSVTKEAGWSRALAGELHGSIPAGGEHEDMFINWSASAYDRDDISGPANQLQAFGGALALTHQGHTNTWSAGVFGHTYRLYNEHYLDEYGASVSSRWRHSAATSIDLSLEVAHQDFDEPIIDLLAASSALPGTRDGERLDVNLAVNHRFSAHSQGSIGVGYEYKTASYKPFGYNAPNISGRWRLTGGKGTYLSASGTVRLMDYHGVDTFFLGVKRRDTRGDARLALGAPLSAFSSAGATGDFRENLLLEGALTYASRASKSPLADYSSWGAEMRLVWRFGAGN